jgi:hypothetical protein
MFIANSTLNLQHELAAIHAISVGFAVRLNPETSIPLALGLLGPFLKLFFIVSN